MESQESRCKESVDTEQNVSSSYDQALLQPGQVLDTQALILSTRDRVPDWLKARA